MGKYTAAVLSLLLLGAVPGLHTEATLGATASIDFQLMIDPDSSLTSDLEQVYELVPRLTVLSDTYEFSAAGSARYEGSSGAFEFALQEFKLAASLTDFMTIRLGYFSYLPGTAEFFSNTDFFARTDYERLLSGSLEESIVPATLLQTGVFIREVFLLLTVSPCRPEMVLPATNSPWFYGKDIPKTVIHPFFGTELVRDQVYYAEAEAPPYDFTEVSVSPEAGGTVWGVDFSLLYYYGYDNDPLLEARFEEDGDQYDIELTPSYRKIHAVGLNLATNIGALRLWGDGAFTLNKSYLANRVSYNRSTPVVQSPFVEYTLGFSYEFSVLDLVASAELKNSHVIDPSPYVVEPPLRSVLVTALGLSLFEGRLSAFGLVTYSIADPSAAAVLKITFTPFGDLAVRVLAPFFFGPSNSEFGQYSRNHYVSAQVVCGF